MVIHPLGSHLAAHLSASDKEATLSHLQQGGLLIYPTDTLWGLGGDPHHQEVLKRLTCVKKRDLLKKPLHLLVKDLNMAQKYVNLDEKSHTLMQKLYPKPVTFVLPAKDKSLAKTLGGGDSLGLRFSSHPWAKFLFSFWQAPLISTSANPSGQAYGVPQVKDWSFPYLKIVEGFFEQSFTKDKPPLGSTIIRYGNGQLEFLRKGKVSVQYISELAKSEGISV